MSENSNAGNVKYVIYENDVKKKVRIHIDGGCGHSERPPGHSTKNGRWHGPFDTLQEAEAEQSRLASAGNGKIVDKCDICFP